MCGTIKVMSDIQTDQEISALTQEISEQKKNLVALEKIIGAIQTSDSFSETEKIAIDSDIKQCRSIIDEKELMLHHRSEFINTIVVENTKKLLERERVLNDVFSQPSMTDFKHLMKYFVEYHNVLKLSVKPDEKVSQI